MKDHQKSLNNLVVKSQSKEEIVFHAFEKLEKSIRKNGLKVILIVEGNQNETSKTFIKKLLKWSTDNNNWNHFNMNNILENNSTLYFEPLISNLPKTGQVSIFQNCWYQKSLSDNQNRKSTHLNSFLETEKMLIQSNYIFLKYALKNKGNHFSPIFEILKQTENPSNPVFFFNCKNSNKEYLFLIEHFSKQITLRKSNAKTQ